MELALLGIGKIAVDQHIPAINASGDWTLRATVSRHGSVEGVDAYTDFDAFLSERQEIRVVSLAMPPVPRFAYAAAAIAAGRHVMLEKPPGTTMQECHQLAVLAQAAGVTLFATWHSREAAMVAAAKAWLADKRLRRLAVTWKEDVRRWHPGQDWIWEDGGMGVFDPGINALSIVTEILPDRLQLNEAVLETPESKQMPIAAHLRFAHPQGAEISAVFDWRQQGPQTWRIEAETDAGILTLEDGGGRMIIDGMEQPGPAEALAGEYPRLYARMAKLVVTGETDTDFEPLRHVSDVLRLGHRMAAAQQLEGQLTATLQMAPGDKTLARRLLPMLERKAGRILANGFPTGVEAADAMVHGGPYPAKTNFGASSVGTIAIRRFLRPVCYQAMPPDLVA